MDQELRDGDLGQGEEPLLTLTDTAVAMIKQAMERAGATEGGIRMTVTGGGCEGFQYSLHLDTDARTDDAVVVQDGITAFLDPVSARHLHCREHQNCWLHQKCQETAVGNRPGSRSTGCGPQNKYRPSRPASFAHMSEVPLCQLSMSGDGLSRSARSNPRDS